MTQFSIYNMQLSEINHFYLYILKQLWLGWECGCHSSLWNTVSCSPGHYSTMVYMASLLNHYLLILETEGDCTIQISFFYSCYSRTQSWSFDRAHVWIPDAEIPVLSELFAVPSLPRPAQLPNGGFLTAKEVLAGVSLPSRVVGSCWPQMSTHRAPSGC